MKTRALLAATLVALAAGQADAALLINEITFNPTGADAPKEYVELRNTDAAALTIPAGTYLVGIEGDTGGQAGDVQTIFDVSGLVVPANGYLAILQMGHAYTPGTNATIVVATGAGFTGAAGFSSDQGTDIENAGASFLLINAPAAPTLTTDIDADNDGVTDGTVFPTWTVLDSVAVIDGNPMSRTYAAITFARTGGYSGPGAVTMEFGGGYVGRIGNSTGSTAADWVVSEPTDATTPATGLILSVTPDVNNIVRTLPVALAGEALDHVGAENPGLPANPNDAPVVTVPTNAITLDEGASQAFGAAGSNAITIADPDAGTAAIELELTASSGVVTLATLTGLTVTAGANASATVTVTGSLTAINTALDGLTYFAGPDETGVTTLTITADDQGNTGAGGALTDSEVITFTHTAQNDAPTVGVPAAQMVQVNGMLAFSTATGRAITIADPDAGTSSITVTAGAGAGTLAATAAGAAVVTNSGTALVTIAGTLADVNATLQTLVFTAPAAQADTVLLVTANDGGATGAGGALTGQGSVNIAVTGAAFLNAPAGPFTFTTALGGTSNVQTLMVMAGALTGPITVATQAPFQVSAMQATGFGLTASLPATGGMLYVRYAPTTGTDHTATITYAAAGVTSPTPTALVGEVFRITTGSLPEGQVPVPYTATAAAEGGVAPVTWSLQAGAPAWLSISATGELSGTPTDAGTFSVTLVATDDQDQTATATLQLVIEPATLLDSPITPVDAPEVPVDATVRPDAPGGTPGEDGDDDGGCCGTSRPGTTWLLGIGVVALLVRRRRRTA